MSPAAGEGELAQTPSAGTWEGHTHRAAVDFSNVLFPSLATRSPSALGFSSTFRYSFSSNHFSYFVQI